MEAKSALRAKVWRAEKEVLPEDTDQPADAQDPNPDQDARESGWDQGRCFEVRQNVGDVGSRPLPGHRWRRR